MSESLTPRDRADVLLRSIEHQLKALESLERIRWSGLALLGGIGFLALYAQARGLSDLEFSLMAQISAGVLAIAVSVSGSIIQLRISALAVGLMSRIRTLQAELASLYHASNERNIQYAMQLPSGKTYSKGLLRLISTPPVSLAYFIFFGTAGAIGLAHTVYALDLPADPKSGFSLLPVLAGALFFIGHCALSLFWSFESRRAVDQE